MFVTTLLGLSALVVVALAIVWLKDRLENILWHCRNPPAKQAEDRRARERRLLNPDWAFYERHLQRPVPASLRALFLDRSLLLSAVPLERGGLYITSFEPIDAEGLKEARAWVGAEVVPFASCDGDDIYLRPGPSEPDRVYISYHDGGDTEELESDVAAFVEHLQERSNAS